MGDIICNRPLTRNALALCNFQTDQVVDGVAKLIRVSDMKKLSNDKSGLIESTLKQAWEIMQAVHDKFEKPIEDYYPAIGKVFVRVCLHAMEKNKANEGREFTLDEIKQSYLADMSALVGTDIKYELWQSAIEQEFGPPNLPQAVSSAAGQPALMTLDEQSAPGYIASQRGFSVGMPVHQKGLTPLGKRHEPCQIMSISEHVQLSLIGQYNGATQTVDVPLREFFDKFEQYKGILPVKLVAAPMGALPAQAMFSKSCLFIALHDAFVKLTPSTFAAQLCFWQKPDQVRTTCQILPGQLVLVPMAPLANIVCGVMSSHSISLGKHKGDHDLPVNFSVVKPSPCKDAQGDFGDASWLVPFWWVQESPSNALVNMTWGFRTFNGCPIPVLENKIEIGPFTQLLKPARATPKSEPKGAPSVVATQLPEQCPPKSATASSSKSKPASKAKSAAPKDAASKSQPANKKARAALDFFGTPA